MLQPLGRKPVSPLPTTCVSSGINRAGSPSSAATTSFKSTFSSDTASKKRPRRSPASAAPMLLPPSSSSSAASSPSLQTLLHMAHVDEQVLRCAVGMLAAMQRPSLPDERPPPTNCIVIDATPPPAWLCIFRVMMCRLTTTSSCASSSSLPFQGDKTMLPPSADSDARPHDHTRTESTACKGTYPFVPLPEDDLRESSSDEWTVGTEEDDGDGLLPVYCRAEGIAAVIAAAVSDPDVARIMLPALLAAAVSQRGGTAPALVMPSLPPPLRRVPLLPSMPTTSPVGRITRRGEEVAALWVSVATAMYRHALTAWDDRRDRRTHPATSVPPTTRHVGEKWFFQTAAASSTAERVWQHLIAPLLTTDDQESLPATSSCRGSVMMPMLVRILDHLLCTIHAEVSIYGDDDDDADASAPDADDAFPLPAPFPVNAVARRYGHVSYFRLWFLSLCFGRFFDALFFTFTPRASGVKATEEDPPPRQHGGRPCPSTGRVFQNLAAPAVGSLLRPLTDRWVRIKEERPSQRSFHHLPLPLQLYLDARFMQLPASSAAPS